MKLMTTLACIALLLCTTTYAADKKGANSVTAERSTNSQIEKINLVNQMAALARTNKDAVLMLAAAKLDAQIPKSDAPYEKKPAETAATPTASKPPQLSLFEQASDFAKGNKALLALIAQTQKDSTAAVKGLVGGPAYTIERVEAQTSDIFAVEFEGGEYAEVAISGDGDTDLDLYVFDENENLICSSLDAGDDEYCKWSPRWTGTFYIQIQNLGTLYNEYELATN